MKQTMISALLGVALAALPLALTADQAVAMGPLDSPRPQTQRVVPGLGGVVAPTLAPARGITNQRALVRAVIREQAQLERLPRRALEQRARSGERAAQVVLGADFALEAESLAFAPSAANAALEDAVRWYNEAASAGFPGAPSLDEAGIEFFPIRVQRARR